MQYCSSLVLHSILTFTTFSWFSCICLASFIDTLFLLFYLGSRSMFIVFRIETNLWPLTVFLLFQGCSISVSMRQETNIGSKALQVMSSIPIILADIRSSDYAYWLGHIGRRFKAIETEQDRQTESESPSGNDIFSRECFYHFHDHCQRWYSGDTLIAWSVNEIFECAHSNTPWLCVRLEIYWYSVYHEEWLGY